MLYDTSPATEAQALRLVRRQLGRIRCPRCQKKRYVRSRAKRYYCKHCRYAFSLKALLGFKGSKLSYCQILALIVCFSKRRTLKVAMDAVNVSYPTVRLAYHRIRQIIPKTQGKIAGDIIVDEAYVGKQKTENQVMVAGAVNRAFTAVRLKPIPDDQQHTLEQFLVDHVTVPSMVATDGHPSYYDIHWYGYGHQIDVHERGQLKKTVPIERVWSLLKEMIRRVYHHIWKESIAEYLVEFMARFNHREIVSNPLSLLTYILNHVSTA